ncbi:MAG: alpha/beta hydrolase fold domain-containing protein [Urechidicola sp.]|nr:alpha/beta hydrolase fold domain-containing protein [Urechidicola sp.]
MIKNTNISVKSSIHNKPIVTDVFYKQTNSKKPIIIFCHGYKGYKDWGAWNLMANSFAENVLFFVKLNFSHNGGTLENPIDFPDLNAFGENNFILELNDLEDVINWIINNNDFEDEIDLTNITLIGHSRGGGIVSIKASENKNISKVITLNGVSNYAARFPKGNDLIKWKNEGVMYVINGRTKQEMPHYYQFYENFLANEKRLTIKKAIENLQKPMLIVSGGGDVVVTSKEGELLHSWNPKSELFFVDEMNHTLGGKHPWEGDKLPKHLDAVVKKCVSFIRQ